MIHAHTLIFADVTRRISFQETNKNLGELWRQAANFYLRSGELQIAADVLQELVDASPSDTKTLAQLVVAYVQFCPTKAQALSKRLPPLHDLAETTDVDALESSNWVIGTKVVKKKIEPSPGYVRSPLGWLVVTSRVLKPYA